MDVQEKNVFQQFRAPLKLTPTAASAKFWASGEFKQGPGQPALSAWSLRASALASAEPTPFRSGQLETQSAGFLRFRMSGRIGSADSPLLLVDSEGTILEKAYLDQPVGERWKTVHLPLATKPGDVSVPVLKPTALAFMEPVEVGYLSWLARKVRQQAPNVALFGLVGFFGGIVCPLFGAVHRRRHP